MEVPIQTDREREQLDRQRDEASWQRLLHLALRRGLTEGQRDHVQELTSRLKRQPEAFAGALAELAAPFTRYRELLLSGDYDPEAQQRRHAQAKRLGETLLQNPTRENFTAYCEFKHKPLPQVETEMLKLQNELNLTTEQVNEDLELLVRVKQLEQRTRPGLLTKAKEAAEKAHDALQQWYRDATGKTQAELDAEPGLTLGLVPDNKLHRLSREFDAAVERQDVLTENVQELDKLRATPLVTGKPYVYEEKNPEPYNKPIGYIKDGVVAGTA